MNANLASARRTLKRLQASLERQDQILAELAALNASTVQQLRAFNEGLDAFAAGEDLPELD